MTAIVGYPIKRVAYWPQPRRGGTYATAMALALDSPGIAIERIHCAAI